MGIAETTPAELTRERDMRVDEAREATARVYDLVDPHWYRAFVDFPLVAGEVSHAWTCFWPSHAPGSRARAMIDQTDANRDTPLSPRRSFASWTQSVTGTAPAWGELAGDALDLARDIEGALLRRVESDLAQLAMHDQLTGLPNRRPLIDRLDALVHDQSVGDVSLLFIDLDGFKEINDTYGHDVGDAVITSVAQSILAATRAEDLVARLGGDEFVILCPGLSARDAVAAAGRVQAAVPAPLLIDGTTIVVTASIGCASLDASALGTGATDVAADLLRRAEHSPRPRTPSWSRFMTSFTSMYRVPSGQPTRRTTGV